MNTATQVTRIALGRRFSTAMWIIFAVVVWVKFTTSVDADGQREDVVVPLFHDLSEAQLVSVAVGDPSPDVVRSRQVLLDTAAIPLGPDARGRRLGLNLFDDAPLEAVIDDVVDGWDGAFTLIGRLAGEETSEVVLTCRKTVMIGSARTMDGRVFRVRAVNDQVHLVEEVDEEQLPPCGTTPAEFGVDAVALGNQPRATVAPDDGSTIDLLVVYTPSARDASGGASSVLTGINNAVAAANLAYQNSQIGTRLRLVYVGEINYTESTSFNTDLTRLRGTTDGYMDEVHTLRNTYGADVVSLIINDTEYCGLGYIMTSLSNGFATWAFNAVHWSCLGTQTLAHEVGHNQGCMHDRENSSNQGLYPYSYGWRFNDNGGTLRRTVMAYAPGSRISYFSNPAIFYNGVATGVAITQTNSAHNAQTINNSAYTMANFRQAVTALAPPTGVSASDGTYTDRVVVSWNTVSSADSYEVWRNGSDVSGSATRIATVATTSHSDTTARAGDVYFYWVKSKQGANTSGFSTSNSGYARDNTPAAPSNLLISVVSTSRLDLRWTDNATNESGFRIERASSSLGPWTQVGSVVANLTTFSHTGLTECTRYFYRVQAYNADADSGYTPVAQATTAGCLPPPSAPTGLTATAASGTVINLSWTDTATNESVYEVERADSSSGPWSSIATLGANSTSYANTGLIPATTHYYRVRAGNNGGYSAWSNIANATTPQVPPTAPTSLAATTFSGTQINLTWLDSSINESGFEIERAPSASGPWTSLTTVLANATSYANTGLSGDTTYYYRVRSVNSAGPSAWSNTAQSTTQTTPPAAPTGLIITTETDSQIALAWVDNASNERSYNIERASSPNGTWVLVGNVSSNIVAYSSINLASCTTYYYRVRAYNFAGYSAYTEVVSGTTIGCAPTIPLAPSVVSALAVADDKVTVCWTDQSDNEAGFTVQQATSSTGPWRTVVAMGANSGCFSNTGLLPSTRYYYRVASYNAAGRSAWIGPVSAKTQLAGTPDAPSDLAAVVVSGPGVDLTWQDNSNNETKFKIQRRDLPGGSWALLDSVAANVTTYSDATVLPGVTYEYRVRASNASGNSYPTPTVSVTP